MAHLLALVVLTTQVCHAFCSGGYADGVCKRRPSISHRALLSKPGRIGIADVPGDVRAEAFSGRGEDFHSLDRDTTGACVGIEVDRPVFELDRYRSRTGLVRNHAGIAVQILVTLHEIAKVTFPNQAAIGAGFASRAGCIVWDTRNARNMRDW
jgi:hypothetical protein